MRIPLSLFFILSALGLYAQDMEKVRNHIDTLCSSYMGGRGYVDDGEKRAGEYISNVFNGLKLIEFDGTERFQQEFPITVNTFPGEVRLLTNHPERELKIGIDFLPAPYSGAHDVNDSSETSLVFVESPIHGMAQYQTKPTAIIAIGDKEQNGMYAGNLDFQTRPELIDNYITRNVIAYVPGTIHPDSFMVFCGHFDHLGKIGPDVFFPGANDNASGTAMVLSLAEYYAQNPQPYSIAFMAFGAEEVGLLGSKHYVENPLFPLNQIKFVVNLDILGGGDDGIQVVNGRKHQTQFDQLVALNEIGGYLPLVKIRGASNNSDHAPFDAKGVPAFFIYTLGGATHYHDIDDKPEFLTLAGFEGLYRLLIDFTTELQITE